MTPAKILIVDEEAMLAKKLAEGLQRSGYEVVGRVTTGEDAVRMAEETRPDLILIDIKLEGKMDGIEASTLIRSRHDSAIVYLTTHTATDVFEKAKLTNPYAYLTKPVSPQELERMVEIALYKRQMDKIHEEGRATYRHVYENMPNAVAIYKAVDWGNDFVFTDFNSAGERIECIGRDSVVGRSVLEVFPGTKESGLFDVFQRVWQTGHPEHHGFSLYKDDRISGWRDNYVYKLPSGEIVAVYSDETERKTAEEDVIGSEQPYRILFEGAMDPILILDMEGDTIGRIVAANPVAAELHGYEPDELPGLHISDLDTPESAEKLPERVDRILRGECVREETSHRRRDGSVFTLEVSASLFEVGGHKYALAIERDITEQKASRLALERSEERFRLAMEASNDGLWDWNIETGEVYRSPAFYEMLGCQQDDFAPGFDGWKKLLHPNDSDRVLEKLNDCLAGKSPDYEVEFRIVTKSGEYKWILSRGKVVERDEDGLPLRMLGTHTDITDRKKAEEALRESEEHYRAVFDNAGIGIDSLDRNGRILKVNGALSEMLGYTEDELRHLGFLDITYPDDSEPSKRALESVLAGEIDSYRMEKRYLCKDETVLWADLSASVVRGEDGEHNGIVGVIADITDRKMVEEALRESEAQKRAILDGITTNMAFVNEDLEILWVNKTAADSVGKSPQEMLGHKCHEFWADPKAPCEDCPTVRAFKTKKSEHIEIVTPDGRVWDEKGEPVFDDEGKMLGVIEIAQDITDRRLAEDALSRSEERYRRIVETANEGIWAMDREFRTTFVNRKMAEMLGYSVEDMVGRRFDSFLFEEDLADHESKMEVRRQGGDQIYERRLRRKDGESLWTTVSATAIKDSEGDFAGSFAMCTDITDRKKMEVMLREREEQLQAIFRASPAAICLVNLEGRITFSNQSMGTLFTCESDELLGTPYLDLVHPEERSIGYGKMRALMDGLIDHVNLERRYVSKDGREFLGHLSGRGLHGPDGELTGLVGIIADITDRKKAEEALRESKEHYKNFFENALVGLFRSRLSDGLFLDINTKAAEQQGLPAEEIIGKVSSADLYRNPDQRNELISRLRRDGEVHDFEADLTLHDGREATFSISVKAYPEKDYLEGAVIDITDQKKAEAALRKNEAFLEAIWRTSPVGIAVARNRAFTWVNKTWAEMFGYGEPQEAIGLSSEVAYASAQEFQRIGTVFYETLKTQTVAESDALCRRKDGSLFYGHTCLTFLNPHNPDEGVIGATIDITDRKKAEDALKESEEKFRTIFEGAGDGIFGIDPETRKAVVVSPSMCGITGYTQSELLQLSVEDLHPQEYIPHVLEQFFRLLHGEISVAKEVPVVRKNGDVIYCDISVGFSHFGGRKLMLGYFRDVTELKLAEQTIRESQERYRILFEQSKDAILISHPEGMIMDANPACGDLFGAPGEEIVGANVLQFYENPQDSERLRQEIGRRGFAKDFELRVRQRDGGQRNCLLTSSAWKGDEGSVIAYLSIARDITESKRLEEQLLQSQKMEAVGTLAGGIAHDFNNLLQVIQGYADIALLDISRNQAGHSELVQIRSAARKAADLTQSLLTFSRRVEGELRPLDLNQELKQISRILERTIPKMVAIELNLAPNLMTVKADPGQLQQAVMNLAVNARDAMPSGGRLLIETTNVVLDEEFCQSHLGTQPGFHVLLAVSDTGSGMDAETKDKIFDPFFTTKEIGKGTGLGLSIVFGIVKSHGGIISCYSEPDKGTAFKIYFPAIKQAQGHEVQVELDRPIGGPETILLVDDEDAVRQLGESLLRRFGYYALTASSGREALEILQKHRERVSLVILDLIMPEMSGRECLNEIMKSDPSTKVLIASGYAADGHMDAALEAGAKASIRKPYDARQLLEMVRRVLDEV